MNETMEIQEPTVADKINKALDGRTQVTLVDKIRDFAETMSEGEEKYMLKKFTDVKLSRKMNGRDTWEPYELKAISKILKIKF